MGFAIGASMAMLAYGALGLAVVVGGALLRFFAASAAQSASYSRQRAEARLERELEGLQDVADGLLPCGCGAPAYIEADGLGGSWIVGCSDKCDPARTRWVRGKPEKARDYWNDNARLSPAVSASRA